MNENNVIEAEIIKGNRFMIYLFVFCLCGVFSFLAIAVKFKIPIVAIIGIIVFFVLPFSLLKKIALWFTKKARFVFYEDHFTIMFLNIKTQVEESTLDYFYKDIDYCIVNSSTTKYSKIAIHFNNAGSFDYNLGKIDDEKICLSEAIYKSIKLEKPDVVLKPTLYASNAGTIIIVCIFVAIAVMIVIHLLYALDSLPLTLIISLPLTIQIITKRKSDIEAFKKLNGTN